MMQSVAAAAPLASRREPKVGERERREKDGRAKEKKKEEEREREREEEGRRGGRICTVGTSYNAQWRETGTWKGFK